MYTDKQNTCNQLNDYFLNVGNYLSEKLPSIDTDPAKYKSFVNCFMFRSIYTHEVYDEIVTLKVNKSMIGTPRKCIKLSAIHICEALMLVFNQSLQQRIFLDMFKLSSVTPVHKGGEEIDPTNYRPIWTLSVLTQMFEKRICKQLLNYLVYAMSH